MADDSGRETESRSPDGRGTDRPEVTRRRSTAVIFLIAGGLVVILLGAFMLWQTGRPAGPGGIASSPRLVADRDEIDFGQVPYNKRVKATFRLTNEGGQPLQIVGQPRVDVVKGC